MEKWLEAALDYIPRWLEFQVRVSEQPGCIVAVAHRDQIVLERAFGHADLIRGETLTPRHRFRIASHSKSFTTAGLMKLCERGTLRLDDRVGQHVKGLHRKVAEITLGQLLSHSAGIIRDGSDAGWFAGRRPFPTTEELLAALKVPPVIEPNTRFKYSNHAFGLLGLVIEAIAGEPYLGWIKREIVDAAGLDETEPDMPIAKGAPFARGHSTKSLLGRRLVIPGDEPLHAIAPAGGFVSTASDVARFFAQLAPAAKRSVLSVGSRREMTRRHWRYPNSALEIHYGLGVMSGSLGGWNWFGHSGGLAGYAHLRAARARPHDLRAGQCQRWLGGILGRRRDAYPARIRDKRGGLAQGDRLDGPVVEHLGCDRPRADGLGRSGCQSAYRQPVPGRQRARSDGQG